MKAINLLVNSVLPKDLRDPLMSLDKKSLDALLANVARQHPEQYSTIVQAISNAGRRAAYWQGETLTLADMKPVIEKEAILAKMDAELDAINASDTGDDEKTKQKMAVWSRYATDLEKLTKEQALARGNNLGNAVLSGARGNPFQLKAMLTTPALYTDYKDQTIPLFVRRGFNEGLRPYEYLASTFGVRKGVISTKASTAESGDLAKQLVQAAANVVVTDDDCGTSNGLDYDVDDREIEGRVLSKTYGRLKAGTPIDKEVMKDLRAQGVEKVIARSPMTCQAKNGICAECLGLLPDGKFAPLGYSAGITAAQAVSEPLTQGALNTKHGGGGFKGDKKMFAGFNIIDQIMQSPETFPYKAAVSTIDGQVDKIEDAPQGGKFIYVGGEQHYVLPGFEPIVKPGDQVEEGDTISEGITDVYDVLKHRGLGEARRYYVDRLRQAFEESDAGRPSKINLETLARATLDHVVIEDPDGMDDYLPDDTASYNRLSTSYSPASDTKNVSADQAVGRYLQSPVLHFTINTKLTPKMVNQIRAAGINSVPVSYQEPKFRPEMLRLRAAAHPGTDWLAKMHTSYLMSNLGQDAARARETNVQHNVHFAPRLAVGEGFGENVEGTGEF